MLTPYIEAAMQHAQYEQLPDDGSYFGSIPLIQGPWANEATLAACQVELRSALEDWILFSVANHCDIPTIDGITLHYDARQATHTVTQPAPGRYRH